MVSAPRIAVVLVSRNRPQELLECIESVVRQSVAAEVVLLDNASDTRIDAQGATVLRTPNVLGVASARNLAAKHCTAPVLAFLDDDAIFAQVDALDRIIAIFDADPGLSGVALNCRAVPAGSAPDFPGLEQMTLIRGMRRGIRPVMVGREQCVPCAVFVGAGCAFRRDRFEAVGGFREDFVYGGEELHLSLRLMEAGGGLVYAPGIRVRHFHSVTWRLSDAEREMSHLRNRWVMAAELLPAACVAPSLLPLTVRTLRRMAAAGLEADMRSVWREFRTEWRRNRHPVSWHTAMKAIALRGRL